MALQLVLDRETDYSLNTHVLINVNGLFSPDKFISAWIILGSTFCPFLCKVFIQRENTMQNLKQMLHAEQGQLPFKVTLMPLSVQRQMF